MKACRLSILIITLTVSLFFVEGCMTAAKEGIGVVRGASGVYAPTLLVAADKDARPLGQYRRFEIGEFVDDFGGKVPPSLLGHFRASFGEQLAKKKIPNEPAGKTLLIQGRILHYESASTLGVALGPLEEILARVQLVDKETGKVLGEANCIGRTTNRVNIGIDKKGQGLAKAIVSWIDSRYPQQGRLEE